MIHLDLTNQPAWLDLGHDVRLHLRPLTTALMVASRNDPDIAGLANDASDEESALVFAKALARNAILDWEGVGDNEGHPVTASPEGINALLDIWPLFEAFQTQYVAKGLILDQEKNASAPLPTGSTAGAQPTVQDVKEDTKATNPAKAENKV